MDDRIALLSGLHPKDIVYTHGGFQYASIKRAGDGSVFKGKCLRTNRWHKFAATHVKKIEKHMGESIEFEAEDLQELSRETRNNYVRAAQKDAGRHHKAAVAASREGNNWKAREHAKVRDKRERGILRSWNKKAPVTKEETDLQELSNKTLKNYLKGSEAESKKKWADNAPDKGTISRNRLNGYHRAKARLKARRTPGSGPMTGAKPFNRAIQDRPKGYNGPKLREETEMDPIDFIDVIADGDNTELEPMFDAMMKQRVADMLAARKEEIAMRMFDGDEADTETTEDE
jgi:hypothetical protein